MAELKDLTGRDFERLHVVCRVENTRWGEAKWLCRCVCGNERKVTGKKLLSGHTQSCGCLQKDKARIAHTTHGMRYTSEHTTWCGILERCYNPNKEHYPDYGGRGIAVCERWQKFENFYTDMGPKPGRGFSIERIDNNGNYEPGNCKWATQKEQCRNKRNNVRFTAFDLTMIQDDWVSLLQVSKEAIKYHLKKGESMEDVVRHFGSPQLLEKCGLEKIVG